MTIPHSRVLVEACVESLADSLVAEQGGADRLELCDDLSVGGITPNSNLIAEVKRAVKIPIAVMVRPRGGSFVFSNDEIDTTRRELDTVLSLGADMVVIGALDASGRVDARVTRELVERANGVPVTFHRAFDAVTNQLEALDMLIDAGVSRILTGGGPGPALNGIRSLAALVDQSGGRLSIMAGGKVRPDNVAQIVKESGVREVHARCEQDRQRIRQIREALL